MQKFLLIGYSGRPRVTVAAQVVRGDLRAVLVEVVPSEGHMHRVCDEEIRGELGAVFGLRPEVLHRRRLFRFTSNTTRMIRKTTVPQPTHCGHHLLLLHFRRFAFCVVVVVFKVSVALFVDQTTTVFGTGEKHPSFDERCERHDKRHQ